MKEVDEVPYKTGPEYTERSKSPFCREYVKKLYLCATFKENITSKRYPNKHYC